MISRSVQHFHILRLLKIEIVTQTKDEMTQLLVPKSRGEMLFQAAHHNPIAEHLGQDKTLNYLMACFYWPGVCGGVWHVWGIEADCTRT